MTETTQTQENEKKNEEKKEEKKVSKSRKPLIFVILVVGLFAIAYLALRDHPEGTGRHPGG